MIPNWTANGILPPVIGENGTSFYRSPYRCTMANVVERYATSIERKTILLGVLNYRAELYKAGIETGFQWLNGSFVEDIETLEKRCPKDADIVTFIESSEVINQQQLSIEHKDLFNQAKIKQSYYVDSYYFFVNTILQPYHIKQLTYWYSMWSHRREGIWKGYLEIPLNEQNDIIAKDLLESSMGDIT